MDDDEQADDLGDVFWARRGIGHGGRDTDDELVSDEDELGYDDGERDGPDDGHAGRRRTALVVLGAVVVLVAVVITLVSVLVDTTPGAPVTPRTTAQAWAGAVVGGDADHRHNLECSGGSRAGSVVGLVVAAAASATAGPARQVGPRRWTVPVSFAGPDGSREASVPITVIRQGRRYVVC